LKALLIDGLNLVRRIYAGVPKGDGEDPDREHINSVLQSTSSSLNRALKTHNPSHCLVVFEQSGRNWRHKLFPDYKKDRSAMPRPLYDALGDFETLFGDSGVNTFSLLGYEADDVIATLATKTALRGGNVVILSTDRIMCQLLSSRIQVYDHFADKFLDAEMVNNKFQVNPEQIPDLLALAGDSGLSIPGIRSIGIHTAAKLIRDYQNLEKILSASNDMPGKLGSKLFNGKQDARIAQQLFSLKTDIELGINLNQFRYTPSTENS
jgi:5'-3' exonuclease